MSIWPSSDRRKFPRVNFPCLVIIRTQHNKEMVLTHVENIGIGGICIILKHSLRQFSLVEVQIDLMDFGEQFQCQGKVVWCFQRPLADARKPHFYEIGVEFQNLSSQNQKRIEGIVNYLTAGTPQG